MNLIKTSYYSFIATVIKLLSAVVVNKFIAMFIGPSGLAVIGQLQSFCQISMTCSRGAINSGVTKYVAEYRSEGKRVESLLGTSFWITMICSLIVGTMIVIFSQKASLTLFSSSEHRSIIVLFGFTIIFFSLNQLLLSVINGYKKIKTFVLLNIVQSIYSLIFTSALVYKFGLTGALVALVTNQSVVFFIGIYFLKDVLKRKASIIKYFDNNEAKKLLKFSLMAITSSLTVPLSHLFVRDYLGNNVGWDQAGYWQAIWYISTMYLMVITTSLSTYYLPRLSEIKNKGELRKELISGYKILVPILISLSFGVYLLRDFVVLILFSDSFLQMRDLFKWQLVGDFFKIASWLLSYILLSKVMTKEFIVCEVVFSVSFCLLTIIYVDYYGLSGVTYAYASNYIMYLFVMALLTKKHWY
ncbi:O-antigen translocase [Psychromonas sp.]|uniref:O-antigen translocase n=1 Tax=Psychromonas sp. TaxID=1884585 RepID=UPI003A96FE75